MSFEKAYTYIVYENVFGDQRNFSIGTFPDEEEESLCQELIILTPQNKVNENGVDYTTVRLTKSCVYLISIHKCG